MKGTVAVFAAFLLSGCMSTPLTAIHQPVSVRPAPREAIAPVAGSIYSTTPGKTLFEDRRAQRVGDTLTINLTERTAAAKNADSSSNRTTDFSMAIPTMSRVPLKVLQGLDVGATSGNKFEGKGASSANNNFTGTITVTVIDVYPNGNLLVSGEKQIAINQGSEFIRFSGVVNPAYVTSANSVNSTQVADARIEYKGAGYLDEAQQMGWLSRFFQVISPF
ncbi:flagellar basal body L-ring protein FlgH [Niveibacterium terrae]|uniref:flagellar basal body L-ring protein FlgH n=1 Tax=Niveibacterium terrae TaxID=3373598 RepID=UPI003A92C17F